MSTIATALKIEITRLARKEVNAQVSSLRKAASAQRAEIASLKRRMVAVESAAKRIVKLSEANDVPIAGDNDASSPTRFSAKSMRSQRKRLGLSAAEVGLLIGSSAQSVYNWEEGKTRPQARHMAAVVSLRSIGRREARKRLETLHASADR
jgi:DNA-binding transcriptional regulator YiaG